MPGRQTKITASLSLARLRAFARRADGSLAIFSLFLFVGLVLMAAVGIDIMRYEQERMRLQGATDRAVLAATSLRQTQDVETVIRDYLARENLEHLIHTIETDQGINFREARVTTRGSVPTLLMHMVGIDQLAMEVISAAEERVPNLEISLVVDLSGSMNNFNRLENLQVAAEEFIETIFGASEEGSTSMSLIPYTGQVNAGPAILDHYDVLHRQEYSHCIDFDAAHYTTTALPTGSTLTGAGHGFPWESPPYTGYYNASNPLVAGFYDCPVAPGNAGLEIVPFSTDPQLLINRVRAMRALGATSIEIGMRWGVALVDPSVQPMAAAMAAAGEIPGTLADRPAPHGDPETMKIVVLMTDGENFEERRLTNAVRSGPSPVWRNTNDNSLGTYSLYNPSTNRYWHRRDGYWHAYPWGGSGQNCTTSCVATNWWGQCTSSIETSCQSISFGNSRQLDWPELFNRTQMYWAARQIFAPANGGTNTQQNNYARNLTLSWQNIVPMSTKDQRLQQICNAAREAGITVFSVAFEADTGGINGLRQCATTPAHFFDVEGVEISEAFRAIASHIRQLRLTE
ncbi:MAG: Tad domain-containing protein [Pararhodobacter sp.]|nr:Tad domain-containing protein [Pararhodobacter sp.]